MRRLLWILILLTAPAGGATAAKEVPPPPPRYVLDQPGWLDPAREKLLEDRLLRFERETSNQIVVALFQSLDGEDLAEYSHRVAEAWGIGQKESDNGILLAVYADDRLYDIEVGYGLEGAVPDAVASRILREVLAPHFRQGDYAGGVLAGVDALMAASVGEFEGTGRARGEDGKPRDPGIPVGLILFALLFLLAGRRGRRGFGPVVFFGGGMGRRGGGGFGGGGGGARGGW